MTNWKTITELASELRTQKTTVRELVEEAQKRARASKDLHAYLEVFDDLDDDIVRAEEIIAHDKEGMHPLAGIPVAIKDNVLIHGKRTTAASHMLENYVASYDATVIETLRKEGAVIVGRTNMDEFAMGASTERSFFGPTKNPHDTTRVPGGSSGGSASAVASGTVPYALGSDTGGSIRQPAAFCGLVGFKPTYGAVSRYGLIAMGSSLDQIGPLTNTVADAEILFHTIRGHDVRDGTTLPDRENISSKKEHLTIGVPWHLLREGVDEDVLQVFEKTLSALEREGHTLEDITLPSSTHALAAYYIVMPAEASTNLARYDGVRYGLSREGNSLVEDYVRTRSEGFGEEVTRRILIGTYVLSSGYIDAYYNKAETLRHVLRKEYNDVFSKGVDVIATPTTPTPAFRFGEKKDPVSMYLADIFTVTANLTGFPAISVPMGRVVRDGKDLPVGIQYTAPHSREDLLFIAGEAVEKAEVY